MRGIVLGLIVFGVIGLAACDSSSPPPPSPTITVLVTKAAPPPTDTPVEIQLTTTVIGVTPPIPSPVPTRSPVPTSTPVPVFVGKTGGDGIWLRASPPLGDKLKAIPDGTRLVVVGPDQNVGGQVWKNVKDSAGTVGWVDGEYLIGAAELMPTGIPVTPTKSTSG